MEETGKHRFDAVQTIIPGQETKGAVMWKQVCHHPGDLRVTHACCAASDAFVLLHMHAMFTVSDTFQHISPRLSKEAAKVARPQTPPSTKAVLILRF